jgi:ribonuclease III
LKPHADEAAKENELRLERCQKALGYRFTDRSLLELALTHSSLRDPWTESNERLEYLGDAVVGLVVSEQMFCLHPKSQEGELTRLRSMVVSRDSLANVAKELDLRAYLRVGKGMKRGNALPPSLLTNTVEALIGAIYLDAGFESARAVVLSWLESHILKARRKRVLENFKAEFQHLAQVRRGITPTYDLVESVGPDHKKKFTVKARLVEREFPPATGSSKKQAEQRAAKEALKVFRSEASVDGPPPDPASA